jgi:hypothetical protein
MVTLLALGGALLAGILLVWLFLRRAEGRGTKDVPLKLPQFVSYYDSEALGVREIDSNKKHLFPLYLVQQIDIGREESQGPERIVVHVAAEFNSAEYVFDNAEAEAFFTTVSGALSGFDVVAAREAVSRTLQTGKGATIYASPHYPDAGIFPQYRDDASTQGAPVP